MYENNTRLSLKMFQQNHSFTFIEDKETILALTNELLDSPFGYVYHPSWYMPDFSPDKYLDTSYREDQVLDQRHIPLDKSSITYAEELTLFGRYWQDRNRHLTKYAKYSAMRRKGIQVDAEECPDEVMKLHLKLYVGYANK